MISCISKLKKFFLISVLICSFSGCSYFGIGGGRSEKSPDELMRRGMDDFEDGDYSYAVEAFQKIKDRYPYSKFAIQAELKMADALFKREEFEQALEAYIEFEKLHPKNESIPYVIYQQGMCHFLRMSTIDRSQTSTKNALKEFARLRKEFPKNPFSLKAQRHIRRCHSNLAEYEFYVGYFYFQSGHYMAALRRFEYLITHYPDFGQYGRALTYLGLCKERLAEEKSLL